MNIDGALSVAAGGLANINRQMALISQNVANASTPSYSVETGTQQTITAAGVGMGVRSGPTLRSVDTALQTEVFNQNAIVAGLQTQQSALQAIDTVQGAPGAGGDIASLLGNLQNQFSALLNSPDNQTQQSEVVGAATQLTRGINALSNAYTTQRQTAQNGIVSEITTLNVSLATIGGLSNQIVALKAEGQSTADLENQRDAAVASLSQLVSVKVLQQTNGDALIITNSGTMLPIHGGATLTTSAANVQPGTTYPTGGIPPIMLGGVDVTAKLQGGQIGANIALRDTTLPTDQAELDEFSQNLASRFDAQGLTMFTDPTGAVPSGSAPPLPVQATYVGFAGIIQVNPAILAQPSLVRDGTQTVGGSPTGPSAFVPNPPGGPAGFNTMINRVLDYALGANAQSGVPQSLSNTIGLGATGNLSAPYATPTTAAVPVPLSQIASTMLASQAQGSAATASQFNTEQAVQTSLGTKLTSQSGVSMDTEMSQMIELQNAYGANARVISAVQAMWTQLLSTVQ